MSEYICITSVYVDALFYFPGEQVSLTTELAQGLLERGAIVATPTVAPVVAPAPEAKTKAAKVVTT